MTDKNKPITWIEYQAQQKGISEEAVRAEMRRRSLLAVEKRGKTGFALQKDSDPEKFQETLRKSAEARQKDETG